MKRSIAVGLLNTLAQARQGLAVNVNVQEDDRDFRVEIFGSNDIER